MKKDKVLLVEDDSTLSFIIQDALMREGFDVVSATNGEQGINLFREVSPNVIVADVMMPKMDGFEMVRLIKKFSPNIPVLFLTARTAIDDLIKGFESGGNDYLRKPFQIIELIIRIKALLKKINGSLSEDETISIGDSTLDFTAQKLIIDNASLDLSHIEAVIINELFRHPNEVVEAKTFMFLIWQNDDYNNLNRLHGFVYKIRKYLKKSKRLQLLNIRGIGYKLLVKA